MRWWQEWPCSLSLLLRSRFGFALSSCFFFWRLCYCTESVSSIEIMIFSQIYISHEALLQQDPLFMQKDAPVVRAAVPTFRDVLWVSHVGDCGVTMPYPSVYRAFLYFTLVLGVQNTWEMLCCHPECRGETELPAWGRDWLESFPVSCWVQLTVVS